MCQSILNLFVITFPLIIGISGKSFYKKDDNDPKPPLAASNTIMEKVKEVGDGKDEDLMVNNHNHFPHPSQ